MEWWMWYSSLALAPDLGHGRTGEVQNHHSELLPRVTWGDSGLRHHQWRDIQSCATVGRWCEEICRWVWRNCHLGDETLGSWGNGAAIVSLVPVRSIFTVDVSTVLCSLHQDMSSAHFYWYVAISWHGVPQESVAMNGYGKIRCLKCDVLI